jgi:hypothetical protein
LVEEKKSGSQGTCFKKALCPAFIMNSVVGYATFVTGLKLENKGPKAVYVALFN